MEDLRLSPHFTLREFEQSATAKKYGIDNTVPSKYVPVLQQLCKEVLEPLRSYVGQPIIISSGYRCNQLNAKLVVPTPPNTPSERLLISNFPRPLTQRGTIINVTRIWRRQGAGLISLSETLISIN